MGSFEHDTFRQKDSGVLTCENVLIVASVEQTNAFDWMSRKAEFPGLTVLPCASTDAVPAAKTQAASLLILEVDPHDEQSMARLARIKRAEPNLPVVAAIADASLSLVRALVREGVADVVSLPFQLDELLETAVAVLSSHQRRADDAIALAPMFAVVRSIGGCGATSIATHLAAELAQHDTTGKGVAIVDLDLQFGSVASYLASHGKGSVADLLEAADRLDEELLRSIARQSDANVSVFAAPDDILPLESVDTDQLLRVIQLLRRTYGYVVLDLPANWTNWTLSAVMAASQIIMVVELSISSLRQAKRRIELFASVDIPPDNVSIVVNRVERRLFKTIDLSDVSETLGKDVLGSITLEDPLVGSAQDQGVLVQQLNRKSRFVGDIAKVSEQLLARIAARGKS